MTFKLHIFYPRTSHRIYLTLYANVQTIIHLISQIATIMLMFFPLQPHFWVQIAMNFTFHNFLSRSYYMPPQIIVQSNATLASRAIPIVYDVGQLHIGQRSLDRSHKVFTCQNRKIICLV